jgi:hypothetical protein
MLINYVKTNNKIRYAYLFLRFVSEGARMLSGFWRTVLKKFYLLTYGAEPFLRSH